MTLNAPLYITETKLNASCKGLNPIFTKKNKPNHCVGKL